MNGTNFTRFGKSCKIPVFLLIFTFSFFTTAWSQGGTGCACKGAVQVSLDDNCEAIITADMLLAGTNDCSGGTVTIMPTPTGQPIAGNPTIGAAWIGKTLYGKVSLGGNSCWTVINVEDKLAPYWLGEGVEEIVTICPALSTYVPAAYDNCSIPTVYIISEEVIVNNCNRPDLFAGADTLKLVTRKYLAVDKSGNVSKDTCEVRIWVTGLDALDFVAVPNVALQCDEDYARLENGNPSPVDIVQGGKTYKGSGVPMLFPWMPTTSGNGQATILAGVGQVILNGGTTGTGVAAVGAQVCITAQATGTISFDWEAVKSNNNNNYAGDPVQYTVNGVVTNILSSNSGGAGVVATGSVTVSLIKGDVFCVRVMTDNAAGAPPAGPGHTIFTMLNIAGVGGIALNPNVTTACNIFVTYEDTKFPTIKCVTKILRKWTILEWSCESKLIEFYQLIEIIDSKGPDIRNLKAEDYATTGGHACEALYRLQKPTLVDNCSHNLTYDVTFPGGFFKGLKVSDADRFVRLPLGHNEITYTAFDECHNQTSQTVHVYVEDNTPPVAICDEWTTVGLTTDGKAWVPATSFDDGSYDECDLAKMVVRRMVAPECIKPCKTPEIPGFKLLDIIDGRHYYISNHAVRPSIALKTAKALENYVVTYNNVAERNAIRDIVTAWYGDIEFVIGYTDLKQKGTFVWEAPSTYVPSVVSALNKYVIHSNDGNLYNVDDSNEYRYVMEVEDPCGFAAYTEFCCNDIGTDQMVRFRAIDKSGNWNECMVRAVVQDKLPPSITCPPHTTVNCTDYFDLAKLTHHFGFAVGYDNCENPEIKTDSIINVNSCRIGTITRTFTVTDRGGRQATCSQHIVINGNPNPFNVNSLNFWPADITIPNGCSDPGSDAFKPEVTGRPNLAADGICSLVGSTYEDQVFLFNNDEGDACFKILRHWSVIDWCQPLYTNGGLSYAQWNHTQVIKVYDREKPVITSSCEPKSVCTYDPTCTSGYIELFATAEDEECTTILRWSYRIDANNDGSFESGLSKSGLGNTAVASGTYPIGNHRIVWHFEDRCGNLTKCEQLFSIVDCKDPTPVCVPLSTALMADPDGTGPALPMVELWAVDFDRKSYKSCNANEVLRFTFDEVPMQVQNKTVFGQTVNINTKHYFDKTGGLLRWQSAAYPAGSAERAIVDKYNRGEENTEGNGRIQLWDPATRSSATVWSSNDLGPQNSSRDVNIFMTVWDEGFRSDFCMTSLKLICNNCGGGQQGNRVAGNVGTETGEMVEEVSVTVSAGIVEFPKSMMTSNDGVYEFMLPASNDFTVQASKDTDYLNGVSTLDLVMIQRHILGLQNLGSPYKIIAADANNDGRITAADLTELRKLILGNVMELPNNSSWRFPVTGQAMDNNNPFPFAEQYTYMDLNSDMDNQNFVAVKIGDVNGSATVNAQDNKLEQRTSKSLVLNTENVKFSNSEVVNVPFNIAENTAVSGLQFTIRFNTEVFELADITSNIISLNDNNFGFSRLAEGLIAVSWNKDAAVRFNEGDQLMTVKLVTKSAGDIASNVRISSEMLKAEAYGQEVEIMDVQLRSGSKSVSEGVVLYQNTPNPFKTVSTIGFELPEAMNATITLYDVTGKAVRVFNNNFEKGYNSIQINRNEVSSNGILYYTLEAGDFKATKKMVIIE